MIGIKSFTNAGAKLVLGDDSPIIKNNAVSKILKSIIINDKNFKFQIQSVYT